MFQSVLYEACITGNVWYEVLWIIQNILYSTYCLYIVYFMKYSLPLPLFFWGVGSSFEQQRPQGPNRRRDSQSHVGGRPAVHGPCDIPPHDLVRPAADRSSAHLPLLHHGLLHLCWVCRHDTTHPRQCRDCGQEPSAASMSVCVGMNVCAGAGMCGFGSGGVWVSGCGCVGVDGWVWVWVWMCVGVDGYGCGWVWVWVWV